jgi:hypothetical protein
MQDRCFFATLTLTISPLGRGDFDWCRVMSCKGYSCDYELLTINNGYDKVGDKLVIRHQTYRQARFKHETGGSNWF